MNIEELLLNIRQMAPQVSVSYCIVNGAIMPLSEVEKMGYEEFSLRSQINKPLKLYKYFPNVLTKKDGKEVNYSLQALKNNTVFMQEPKEFDDPYDSDISLDYFTYERLRLIEYCDRCQIDVQENLSTQEIGNLFIGALVKYFQETGGIKGIVTKQSLNMIEQQANEILQNKLLIELSKDDNWGRAVAKIIQSDYEEYCRKLKNTFRTSCFTTTPYSQLMWSGYANCHKGFCVEYTLQPNKEKYHDLYANLFPMIYCKVRPDMTERLVKMQDKEPTMELVWDIYFHGALRKSIDWAYQNEWRLLIPMRCKNMEDYNIEFFPITKVFLGNTMPNENRKEIIEICKEMNIPYIGVTRKSEVFEMQECSILCENCFKYINK